MPQRPATRLAASANGRWVVGTGAGTLYAWEAGSGELRLAAESTAEAATFSADGAPVAVADANGIEVWEMATGRRVVALKGHEGKTNAVAFLPNGRRLVSGGTMRPPSYGTRPPRSRRRPRRTRRSSPRCAPTDFGVSWTTRMPPSRIVPSPHSCGRRTTRWRCYRSGCRIDLVPVASAPRGRTWYCGGSIPQLRPNCASAWNPRPALASS